MTRKNLTIILSICIFLYTSTAIQVSADCAQAEQAFNRNVATLQNDFLIGSSVSVLTTDAQNVIAAAKGVQTSCVNDVSPQCISDLQAVQSTGDSILEALKSGTKDPAVLTPLVTKLVADVQTARTSCKIPKKGLQKHEDIDSNLNKAPFNAKPAKVPTVKVTEECSQAEQSVQTSLVNLRNAVLSQSSLEQITAAGQAAIASLQNTVEICQGQLPEGCEPSIAQLEAAVLNLINFVKSGSNDVLQLKALVSQVGQQFQAVRNTCEIQNPQNDQNQSNRRSLQTNPPPGWTQHNSASNSSKPIPPPSQFSSKEPKSNVIKVDAECDAAEKNYMENMNILRDSFREKQVQAETFDAFQKVAESVQGVLNICQTETKQQLSTECETSFNAIIKAIEGLVKEGPESKNMDALRQYRSSFFMNSKDARDECDLFRFFN